jgi:hypothetical protein
MAWIPCVRKAEKGSLFCRKHGDAIFGVMLGAVVHQGAVSEAVSLRDAQPPGDRTRTREWRK